MKRLLIPASLFLGLILALGLALSPKGAARIAVVSDLHLSQEHETEAYARWQIILDQKPDAIIVLGDIASVDSDFSSVQADLRIFRQLLESTPVPVLVAPGNHDCEWTAGTSTWRAWAGIIGPLHSAAVIKGTLVLALDTNISVAKLWMNNIYGLSDAELAFVRSQLASHPRLPVIIGYHEPMVEWNKNKVEFLDSLSGRRIQLFAGHYHYDTIISYRGQEETVVPAFSKGWWRGPNRNLSEQFYELAR